MRVEKKTITNVAHLPRVSHCSLGSCLIVLSDLFFVFCQGSSNIGCLLFIVAKLEFFCQAGGVVGTLQTGQTPDAPAITERASAICSPTEFIDCIRFFHFFWFMEPEFQVTGAVLFAPISPGQLQRR